MNTKIAIINAHASKNNILILTDEKNLGWTSEFLNKDEVSYLKRNIKEKIFYTYFPKSKGGIIVQILKKNDSPYHEVEERRNAGSDMLSVIEHHKMKEICLLSFSQEDNIYDFAEGLILGNYQFLKYSTSNGEKKHHLQKIDFFKGHVTKNKVDDLVAICEATCIARDLVNEPLSFLGAEQLSEEIKKLAKSHGFKATVFDKKKIESLKMGGLLAVNKGSFDPPTFNIMEWKPKNAKNKKPIVLVGKGIVYDTGGLSLKPTANSMDFMKSDMGGAATVIGAIAAISKIKLPVHVVALVPSTDNRPGNRAYAPGDVITMYSGKTVEVLNTDAEGRLVLADALHYAKKYDPELVMDFATLTGAAARALGSEGTCFMGTASKEVKADLIASGENVYERLVEFPLWKEYGEYIKSNIADLKNLGGPSAGMITAGKFLEHFVDYPWVHFDIAGAAFVKKSNTYRTKDGTGVGVRLMVDYFKNL